MPSEEFNIFVPGYEKYTKILVEKDKEQKPSKYTFTIYGKLNQPVYNSLLNSKKANTAFMNNINKPRKLGMIVLKIANMDAESMNIIRNIKKAIRGSDRNNAPVSDEAPAFRKTAANNANVSEDDKTELRKVLHTLDNELSSVGFIPQIISIIDKNISINAKEGTTLRENKYNNFFKGNAKNRTIKRTKKTRNEYNPFYTLSTGLFSDFIQLLKPYLIKDLKLKLLFGDPNNKDLERLYGGWGMKPINNVVYVPGTDGPIYWGGPIPGGISKGRIMYKFAIEEDADNFIHSLVWNHEDHIKNDIKKKSLESSLIAAAVAPVASVSPVAAEGKRPNTNADADFMSFADRVKRGKPVLSNENQLKIYSLYKQGTEGNVTGKSPGWSRPVNKAKYNARFTRKGMRKNNARAEYMRLAAELGLV
jgi:acyl-CoA-binding protein